jgi:internalin A
VKGLLAPSRYELSSDLSKHDVLSLTGLRELETIQISRAVPSLRTLKLLNEHFFSKRKDVCLRLYGHENRWEDIGFLSELDELERLDWETDTFGDVAPLYKLKRLAHIAFGAHKPMRNWSIAFLRDFSESLESVSLTGDCRDVEETVAQLCKLRKVWFASSHFDDLGFLQNLASIEIFGNYGSRVKDLRPLSHLQSLRSLWLKNDSVTERLEFIEPLTNLEKIELLYLSKITALPRLSRLAKLRTLFVFECNRLQDIREAMALPRCEVAISGKAVQGGSFRSPG